MEQTKIESLIEVHINIFIGFMVSLTFWTLIIVPIYELPVSFLQNLQITGWFTVLAIARGYLVRRFFNAGLHKTAHALTLKIIGKDGT